MNYQKVQGRNNTSVTVKLDGAAYCFGVKKNRQVGNWGITINELLLRLKYLEEKILSGQLKPASPSIGVVVKKNIKYMPDEPTIRS